MIDSTRLLAGAAALGVALDGCQVRQLGRYAELLAEWNRRMNLTRVPADEVVPLHFLDSLTVCHVVDLARAQRLLDVGTGAGFPGLVLKIAFPPLDATLLDSTRKRLTFVEAVIADLGLSGVATVHARAEDAARLPEHRARYDCVTARAVAPMERLAGWMLPFVRPGGCAIALKSAGASDEVAQALPAIRQLGGDVERTVDVVLPTTDVQRKLVILRSRNHRGGR